ncbi:uncharacterized protein TRAVEDRAFT_132769, partial [Trametes versicolor FP-101664 SS1]|uniref:uncharacterized protein n=1 Tax=Trametes versicolor (strain FP-101664) TaxID=717944 RepID=UPI0004623C22
VEKKLTEIVAKSIWSGNTHLQVSRETLHLPTREGSLNLLDIWAQNEAIDLMWLLKVYLTIMDIQAPWAMITDMLLANAVVSEWTGVDLCARVNTFLQTWKISSTQHSTGLPCNLKCMIQAIANFGVHCKL